MKMNFESPKSPVSLKNIFLALMVTWLGPNIVSGQDSGPVPDLESPEVKEFFATAPLDYGAAVAQGYVGLVERQGVERSQRELGYYGNEKDSEVLSTVKVFENEAEALRISWNPDSRELKIEFANGAGDITVKDFEADGSLDQILLLLANGGQVEITRQSDGTHTGVMRNPEVGRFGEFKEATMSPNSVKQFVQVITAEVGDISERLTSS